MIDSEKIIPIIKGYKEYFPVHWKDEKYKWEAVKHFQENWDIDAENFGEMFKKATEKTSNLLGSGYAYPRGMILEFAKADDNAVREMFRRLYDESLDLSERVTTFMDTAEELRNKYNDGTWKQHYQNTNYISTYLWLMYPEKYYIYKYELYKAVADELDDSYQPKRNGSVETMVGGFRMYDEIRDILQEDDELRQMLNDALTDDCYTDLKMNTAVIDLGFYIARFYKSGVVETDSWFPKPEEYTPGISVENWVSLFNDPKVFDQNSLDVINAFYDIGGQATCSELAEKFGYTAMHYSGIVTGLAKRVYKVTKCPLNDADSENAKWWPILFVGKYADKKHTGVYIWKLRDELKMALEQKTEQAVNAWLLTWNPKNFDWENDEEEFSLDTMFKTVKSGGGFYIDWRCISTKTKRGDMVYLLKLGTEPKGIFASGYIIDDSIVEDNIRYAKVLITKAIDFRETDIISQQTLKEMFPDQMWSPQGSGISIKSNAAKWLIENWDKYKKEEITVDTEEPENAPVIWKISHGLTSTSGINKKIRAELEERHVVTVNMYTGPSAGQKVDQGYSFLHEIKPGDFFYLCYASEIALFGQIVDDEIKINNTLAEGFRERNYKIIALSNDHNKYTGKKKMWTSNFNSTCVKVTDNKLFEELILQPYFGLTISDLRAIEFHEPYTKEKFLKDVFLTEPEYDKLRSLVLRKKNIILQGAPGVGKTFSAKRLAYSIIGEKNENRICMVQFHQNYSYEDFIRGYRPNDSGGFELQNGVFYNFCEIARNDTNNEYFFIIDEINRGNLSKIFGELLMLIETDKRGEKHKLNLVYGGTAFYIPENLHIIGMMNTADRSLAMIDYALRRRFSFYTMQPAFDNAANNGFEDYTQKIQCELYHTVVAKIRELNDTIRKDSTLGKGFEIGHSYFVPEDPSVVDDEWVRNVVEYEILPLIEEYWFDNDKMLGEWTKTLYQAIGEDYDG